MTSVAPLTYTTLADWSRLKAITVLPHEVEALITLDSCLLHPGPLPAEK